MTTLWGFASPIEQVRGKLNAITMDSCTKTGLVFEDLVASCEIVNSASVEVQCTGVVPTIAIDKCDGCQVSSQSGSKGVRAMVRGPTHLYAP